MLSLYMWCREVCITVHYYFTIFGFKSLTFDTNCIFLY